MPFITAGDRKSFISIWNKNFVFDYKKRKHLFAPLDMPGIFAETRVAGRAPNTLDGKSAK